MEQDVKRFNGKENYTFEDLLEIVSVLRSENGCSWDRAQTHESLLRYLLEETYEVAEAIDKKDPHLLKEELGDLLLQILLHAEIEREEGRFSFDAVSDGEARKMVLRHPHIFSDGSEEASVPALWEQNKNKEKNRRTPFERLSSVPSVLPALLRAQKLAEKLSRERREVVSALLPAEAPLGPPPLAEGEEAVGRYLLALTAACAQNGILAETALRRACNALCESAKTLENT